MTINHDSARNPAGHEPAIAQLLQKIDENTSIVDRLLAIPAADEAAANDWDRAVARRLESKLADSLRELMEPRPQRRLA